MKKLPFRLEYLVLGLVIVVLALAIGLRGGNRLRYRLPEPPRLSAAEISRVTVDRAGGGLELENRDGTWRILPQGYKADTADVSKMVSAVAELELTTLVSEASSYARYGLDEGARMVITAYIDGKPARTVQVGKEDEGGRTSFVMLPEDPKVYTARQNLRQLFDVSVDQLRDMTVMTVQRGDVVRIDAARGAQSLTLNKSGDRWSSATGDAWDAAVVDRVLGTLSGLRAQRYGEIGDDLGAEQVLVTLTMTDGSTHTLGIHDKADTTYAAVSSQSEYPFYLAQYQYTDVVSIFDGRKTE